MSSTGEKIGSVLKTSAKVGLVVFLQILLFTAVGILLNLLLTIFLIPEIEKLGSSDIWEYSDGRYSTWDKIKAYLYLFLLMAFFLILWPVVYFFVGKKQGIKAAISKLVHEKGDNLVGFVVAKFTDRMANNPEWKTSLEKNGAVKTAKHFFPGFIRTLNGLPWLLKRPLRIVFEGIDFAGAVEEAYRTRPDLPINAPETNQHITTLVSTKLKSKFQPPRGRLLLVLVIINVVLFVVAKILI